MNLRVSESSRVHLRSAQVRRQAARSGGRGCRRRLRRPRRPTPSSRRRRSRIPRRARSTTSAPVLVDFGPVIGTNVAFFGEQLGCKLFIEDLAADIDRHTRAGTRDALPDDARRSGFRQADGSVDGVLCWDIFDFLDKAAAQALAREIVRVLRPGGAVMGFFCTTAVRARAVHEVRDRRSDTSLRHRPHPGAGGAKYVLQNRDIIKMFDGLIVSDSFLLKSNTREILLRRSEHDVRPLIALLTDFGTRDHYAGTMKGVMLGICPDVTLVDITHDIPPHDVLGGRARARRRLPVLSRRARSSSRSSIPASARRAAASRPTPGDYRFVAPDNGVLTAVLREHRRRSASSS